MHQQDYWNSVSASKNFTTPFQADEFAEHVAKDALIADIGCGYGRTMEELRIRGYENLVGFDFSEGMIERGKAQFPYLDLRVMSEGSIGLADETAAAVILFAVLTCIADDAGQEKLIAEIRRILKPGGILYVNDFLLNSDERNVSRYVKFASVYGAYGVFELPEGAVCRHHSEEHIKELLAGFDALRFEHLTFTTMNGNRSNGFYFIGEKNDKDKIRNREGICG